MGRHAGSAAAAVLSLGLVTVAGCSASTSGGVGVSSATGANRTTSTTSASSVGTSAPAATQRIPATTPTTTTPAAASSRSPSSTPGRASGTATVVRTVATGIDVPWGLARLPDGTVLVSARDSYRIYRLDVARALLTQVGTVPGVVSNVSQQGEAGLLGIAVSPSFARDRLVYAYYSTAGDNRIAAIPWDATKPAGQQLGTPRVLVSGIPHNVHHNGGRISFGPDGYLYATTGRCSNRRSRRTRARSAARSCA